MTPTTAAPAIQLTGRIQRIEVSATMAVVAEADKLAQQGIDVVYFGAGEPHFTTPQHVKDAAIAAIQGDFSKYTAVGGTIEGTFTATLSDTMAKQPQKQLSATFHVCRAPDIMP